MDKLRRYIITNVSLLFFSLFISLLTIASVIFMIKLAQYTAVIKLSVSDLWKLYTFVLPELLFYTLPITFFITAVLALFRLSTDNEMIVLFALGIKPGYILKTLFKPAAILSMVLLFDFLVVTPHTKLLSKNFLKYKAAEAKLNLSASEFGHNFNNWLLYIGKDNKNGTYSDVILFRKDKKEEIIIGAQDAEVLTQDGVFKLNLKHGRGYSYSKDVLTQINFETMNINNMLKEDYNIYRSTVDYWFHPNRRQSKIKNFIIGVLSSLFPLFSLFTVLSIGIVHVRHQKGHVYLSLAIAVLIFYGVMFGLQPSLQFYVIPLLVLGWLLISIPIYYKSVATRF
jgi:lipopolysaccharide export system permease protein